MDQALTKAVDITFYLLIVFFEGGDTHLQGYLRVLAGISPIPIPRRHMAMNIVAREQGYKDM